MRWRTWAAIVVLILVISVLGGVVGSSMVRAGFSWDGLGAVSTLVQAAVTTVLVYVAIRQMAHLAEQTRREDIREPRTFLEESSTVVRAVGTFWDSYLDHLSRGADPPAPSHRLNDFLKTRPQSMRWHREEFFPALQAVYDAIQGAHDATCHNLPDERTMEEATTAMQQLARSCFNYVKVAEKTLRDL